MASRAPSVRGVEVEYESHEKKSEGELAWHIDSHQSDRRTGSQFRGVARRSHLYPAVDPSVKSSERSVLQGTTPHT